MKPFRILFIVITLLTYNLQFAQEDEGEEGKLSLDDGTLHNQFEYLFIKSGNYRADGVKYEVVRESNLYKIRQNVLDSIKASNLKALELQSIISENKSTIDSLQKKFDEASNSLSIVTEEKDSMSFLGILVSKGTYNFILWTVIFGLLFLLALFVYRFRNSNILTQEAKTALSEIETEYEEHRRRALEREQKISRQLQDEINKHKKAK